MPPLLFWAFMARSRLNLHSTLPPIYIQVFTQYFPFTHSYKILYRFLICPMHATCNTYLTHTDLIIHNICGNMYKS